MSLILVTLSVR